MVESFGNGSVSEVPYNDERLEVLFNQLDFGPPSADLLSPSSTDPIAAAENHQGHRCGLKSHELMANRSRPPYALGRAGFAKRFERRTRQAGG